MIGKPVIISTGLASLSEIIEVFRLAKKSGCKKIVLLYCVSSYPAKKDSLNLNIIDELRRRFKTEIGYSDHSLGSTACLAAVAKGASVIEKHVTFSRSLKGPDHKASDTIKDFGILVKKIREIEKILGTNKKKFSINEINVRRVARKSLVANKDIKKGSILKKNDIVFKRPGTGSSPINIKKFLGKKFKIDKKKNKVIYSKELE